MSDISIGYKGSVIAEMSASGKKTLKTSGKYCEGDIEVNYARPTPGSPVIQPLSTTQNGTYNTPSGVDGYSPVTVNVPTGTARSASDLTVSGDTVNVPAGLYAASASKAVAHGSAGTPTATKGTVSNHSVSVTPHVQNTTGYITGGTKNGTPVTVNASELVSGSETKTANGTYDVTNLAQLVVDVSGGGGGLPDVITAGDQPVLICAEAFVGTNTSKLSATGISLTVPRSGTYRFKWCTDNNISSSTGTPPTVYSRLYRKKSGEQDYAPVGSQISVNGGHTQISSLDLNCDAGDTVQIYLQAASQSVVVATLKHGAVSNLVACIDWSIW